MKRTVATSAKAINALAMLSQAQHYFVTKLSQLCALQECPAQFNRQQWLRDSGQHGGGMRFEGPQESLFNQASVNVSQIQYEDQPDKTFISATALSTIIHPINPLIPSVHIHVSWTELRTGQCYWRLMADLNPAIPCAQDSNDFNHALQILSGDYYQQATTQGDKYFYIPTLQKHRGVSHFYLEGFNPEGDGNKFAQTFVEGIIECYLAIFSAKLNLMNNATYKITEAQKTAQIDYHTLYFYQVLTLDKGTTAGLLVHAQNDLGTLASLPGFINRKLLIQWAEKTPAPGNILVRALVALFSDNAICEVTTSIKINIAQVIRQHYKNFPL